MPRPRCHFSRSSFQYSSHFISSAGGTKYSSSINSNSRRRKIEFPGVISLRKALPTWAMPKGGRIRVEFRTFAKLTNIPCAVSGRRYACALECASVSAPRDGAGDVRQLRERPELYTNAPALRHRPGRQGLPQRDHPRELDLSPSRIRVDGARVLRSTG